MSQKTKSDAKASKQSDQRRKALTFSFSSLNDLSMISVDKITERLLIELQGSISISVSGTGTQVHVVFKDDKGKTHRSTIDDLMRVVFSTSKAAACIRAGRKKEDGEAFIVSLTSFLISYSGNLAVFEDLKPLNLRRVAIIKQHTKLAEKFRKNIKLFELCKEREPSDLDDYVQGTAARCIQALSSIIFSLATTDAKPSDLKGDVLRTHRIPAWFYDHLGEATNITSCKSFVFPTKAEKGIRMTIPELQEPSMVHANQVVIRHSKVLCDLITRGQVRLLLNEFTNADQLLQEEANRKVLDEFAWNLVPPLPNTEEEVSAFLNAKKKATATWVPSLGMTFKSNLEKISNTILRSSLMETATVRPWENLGVLIPNDFTCPPFGNWYVALEDRDDARTIVTNYLAMNSANSWRAFRNMFLGNMPSRTGGLDRELFRRQGVDYDPQSINVANVDNLPPGVSGELMYRLLDLETMAPGERHADAIIPNAKTFGRVLVSEGFLTTKKARKISPLIPMERVGQKLVEAVKARYGKKSAEEIRSYLMGFGHKKFQDIAVRRLNAAIGGELKKLEEIDSSSDEDEDDDIEDDGIEFH